MASADAFDLTIKGRTGHGAHRISRSTHWSPRLFRRTAAVGRQPRGGAALGRGGHDRRIPQRHGAQRIAPTAVLKGTCAPGNPAVGAIEAAVRRMLDGMKIGMPR